MPNVYSSATQCPYAHFALKNLRDSCGSVRQDTLSFDEDLRPLNVEYAVLSACSSLVSHR